MYAALQDDGRLIQATPQLSRQQHYWCPQCRQAVVLARSAQGRPFFRHRQRLATNLETTRHEQGKITLQQALQAQGIAAAMEVNVRQADNQRRADVFWRGQQQDWALEFQCAPMTAAELRQRHRSYQALATVDVWLLGATYWQHGPSLAARHFISYRRQWGYFLAYWYPERRCVKLVNHLQYRPPAGRLYYESQWLSLAQFLTQFPAPTARPRLPQRPLALSYDPRPWLLRQAQWSQPTWQTLQQRCYEAGWSLLDLPRALWLPSVLPPTVARWPLLLVRQIDAYLASGALSWPQRWQLYQASSWPLLTGQPPLQEISKATKNTTHSQRS